MQVAIRLTKLVYYSNVTSVKDGQQAIDEIHRQAGPDAFDVILTDQQMPHKVMCY